jgi:hypothetical protein
MADLELADVLVGLRREIQAAQDRAKGENLRFRVDAIEVEVKVGVTSKEAGKAGVKFMVLEMGADLSRELQSMQTLRLKLTPESADGEPTRVSGQDSK